MANENKELTNAPADMIKEINIKTAAGSVQKFVQKLKEAGIDCVPTNIRTDSKMIEDFGPVYKIGKTDLCFGMEASEYRCNRVYFFHENSDVDKKINQEYGVEVEMNELSEKGDLIGYIDFGSPMLRDDESFEKRLDEQIKELKEKDLAEPEYEGKITLNDEEMKKSLRNYLLGGSIFPSALEEYLHIMGEEKYDETMKEFFKWCEENKEETAIRDRAFDAAYLNSCAYKVNEYDGSLWPETLKGFEDLEKFNQRYNSPLVNEITNKMKKNFISHGLEKRDEFLKSTEERELAECNQGFFRVYYSKWENNVNERVTMLETQNGNLAKYIQQSDFLRKYDQERYGVGNGILVGTLRYEFINEPVRIEDKWGNQDIKNLMLEKIENDKNIKEIINPDHHISLVKDDKVVFKCNDYTMLNQILWDARVEDNYKVVIEKEKLPVDYQFTNENDKTVSRIKEVIDHNLFKEYGDDYKHK